jgi:malate synthase
MDLLRRQLLSPRYIQHSARVLFVLGEAHAADRAALLDAIFDLERPELARRVSNGKAMAAALTAHDYVHDVFGEPG